MQQFKEHAMLLKQVDQDTITVEDELKAKIIESTAIEEAISDKIRDFSAAELVHLNNHKWQFQLLSQSPVQPLIDLLWVNCQS